jgi:hypothetical protein
VRTRLATLPLLVALGCGCVSVHRESGIRIGDSTLAQFEAGKTSERWVLAVLGEPTSRAEVEGEDGVHVLRYSLVEEGGGFFARLFGGGSQFTVSTVYFIVRQGTVESFWADRAGKPGLFGGGEASGEKAEG